MMRLSVDREFARHEGKVKIRELFILRLSTRSDAHSGTVQVPGSCPVSYTEIEKLDCAKYSHRYGRSVQRQSASV